MLNTVFASLLVALLCVVHPVYGAENSGRPCEAETAQLMNLESSWSDVYKAAIALPPICFDGYFAEGISDTLVRKMGQDWQGFQTILAKHPNESKFINLVLRSINATLDPNDIRTVDRLANTACNVRIQNHCHSISKEAAVALAEYDLPEPRNGVNSFAPEQTR